MNDPERYQGVRNLFTVYLVGAAIAFLLAASYYNPYSGHTASFGYFVLYILWGGLAVASAHLAVRKGRDLVEGAVLGASSGSSSHVSASAHTGTRIEVFLPAITLRDKDAGGDRPSSQ